MNARKLAVLLLAALALLVAGCGGGDDGGDEAVGTTDTAIVEDDTSTETTDDDGSTATSDDDGIQLEGECAEFAGLSAKLSQALGGTSNDLSSATEVFDELADQVPDEIRDDYEVLAANFRELAEALEGVDLASGETPSPEVLAKLQEVSQSLDTPEVREATENIEAWAEENC